MSGLRTMELPDVQMSRDSILAASSENSASTASAPSRVDCEITDGVHKRRLASVVGEVCVQMRAQRTMIRS